MKSTYEKGACTPTFIKAQFTIAKRRIQHTCPSWTTDVVYIQNEWILAIKKNEILKSAKQ